MIARSLDYPFRIDSRGRAADTSPDDHVRDLIEQVLFTSPGERVNRPELGCGLKQLVFMPNSDALASATQQLVHGSLHRWLEDVIAVERVDVQAVDASLIVTVVYVRRDTGERHEDVFSRPTPV
jgi:phage baseplate assembly protein W